jgi:hypothetical protein
VAGEQPGNLTVYFGATIYNVPTRQVSQAQVHPGYLPIPDILNDIAVVVLANAAPDDVAPIPYLPASLQLTDADLGTELTFVGFGNNGPGSYQFGIKQLIKNNLDWICYGPGDCWFEHTAPGRPYTICHDQDPGGTCQGDSGGPALIVREGKEFVAGVTSYGDEYCVSYGCSTKVDAFEDFIKPFIGDPVGAACAVPVDCESGYCVSGVCCATPCVDSCQECAQAGAVGQCRPKPDGASCANRDVCDGAETCQGGACLPGTPLECQDTVSCTRDTCDPEEGCSFVPTALDCYDGNKCTQDLCDAELGCQNPAEPDDLVCGNDRTCQQGHCRAKPGCGCGADPATHLTMIPLAILMCAFMLRPRGRSR